MKLRRWVVLTMTVWLTSMNIVTASESTPVQTEGTIGFTGVYEPEGAPNPKPSVPGVVRPEGVLPRTNTVKNTKMTLVGSIILGISFLMWKKKRDIEKNKITIRK